MGESAIAGHVVDIDPRRAIAVRAVDCTQQLATLVHLERLPWIEHRGCLEISRIGRLGRIRDIDRAHPDVRSRLTKRIAAEVHIREAGMRSAVIRTDLLRLTFAFTPFGGLPIGSLAADLSAGRGCGLDCRPRSRCRPRPYKRRLFREIRERDGVLGVVGAGRDVYHGQSAPVVCSKRRCITEDELGDVYTLTLSPDGLTLALKGRRKGMASLSP